jgi:hypothetical protein
VEGPLKKALDAWCAHHKVDRNHFRFLYDGKRVVDTDTPASVCWTLGQLSNAIFFTQLVMEDNDTIDAMSEQQGGAACLMR